MQTRIQIEMQKNANANVNANKHIDAYIHPSIHACILCRTPVWLQGFKTAFAVLVHGTCLAFDPTPMVSHLTLPPFWGRVECEKVAFLAAKKRSRR